MLGVRVPPGLPILLNTGHSPKVTKKKVRKLKTAQQTTAQGVSAKISSGEGAAKSVTAPKQEQASSTPVSRIQAFKQYLRDVRAEFDKITWPSRKETVSMTIAVLAISVFFAAYLGLVDISLSKLVGTLID